MKQDLNQESRVEKSVVEELRTGLRGQVFAPGDERYETARAVHNGSIDRRPAVIASCVDVSDVSLPSTSAASRALRLRFGAVATLQVDTALPMEASPSTSPGC